MVTLEISSTDIRLIEVRDRKIVRWASQSLRPGIFDGEIIADPRALGNAVKELLASSAVREKKIVASISGLYSLSRLVDVPTSSAQPLTEQTVLSLIDDLMLLSPQKLYVFWQTVAVYDNNQRILVVGVPRDIIDGEMQALKSAGVNPHLLDLKTLALARVVGMKEAIVLNIDATSFDIVIISRGVTEILRTITWEPESLSIEERAEQLVSALELTVSFFNSRYSSTPLGSATPLVITGHMSGDLALVERLQQSVEYHCEPLTPPLEYPEHMPVSQYAVNIGLALKAAAKSKFRLRLSSQREEAFSHPKQDGYSIPDTNFLPHAYKGWRPSPRLIFSSLAIATVLGLFTSLHRLTTDAMNETAIAKQRYIVANNVMERSRAELRKREQLQKVINDYLAQVAMGGGLVDDITTVRRLAADLNIKTGPITHSGSIITFNSQALDYQTFRDFVTALREDGRFASPVIPPEGYPFIGEGTITLRPKTKAQ